MLVDEDQDTNALQGDLLAELAGRGATLTAVGDDAQAIYGFRAATVRNILDFPARFGADVVTLTRNHRSTPEVLAAANAVMAEAAERHPKELRAERGRAARGPGSSPPTTSTPRPSRSARRVLERNEAGVAAAPPGRALPHQPPQRGAPGRARRCATIPFVLYGGLRFLEAAHVKDLVCALRLVENPADELAWFRVLQLIDGVGPAAAARRRCDRRPSRGGAGRSTTPRRRRRSLARARRRPSAGAPRPPGAQVAAGARAGSTHACERRHRNGAARRADLDRLEQAAGAAPSLERFLTDLTLDPPSSTGDLAGPPHLDDDFLTLSTIHSAKGAEWDVVHLIHLADGYLPSDLATGHPEEIEEERRLLHVAMTRARDDLWLHVPLRYHHHRQNSRGPRRPRLRPALPVPLPRGGGRCATRWSPPLAEPAAADPPVDAAPAVAEVGDFLAGLLE